MAKPKLEDYLLSDSHPVGKWKFRFFRSLGYDVGTLDDLAETRVR